MSHHNFDFTSFNSEYETPLFEEFASEVDSKLLNEGVPSEESLALNRLLASHKRSALFSWESLILELPSTNAINSPGESASLYSSLSSESSISTASSLSTDPSSTGDCNLPNEFTTFPSSFGTGTEGYSTQLEYRANPVANQSTSPYNDPPSNAFSPQRIRSDYPSEFYPPSEPFPEPFTQLCTTLSPAELMLPPPSLATVADGGTFSFATGTFTPPQSTITDTNADTTQWAPVTPPRKRLYGRATEAKGDSRRNHICTFCFRAFKRLSNLKAHEKTHNPKREKPHVCPNSDCNRAFVRKHDLFRHITGIHHE